MKIAILTESSKQGLNQNLAEFCSTNCSSIIESAEVDIFNFSDFYNVWISRYDAFIMILPEWNGSFPHTAKKLIDDSGYPSVFENKDIFLIGTSASQLANVIGVEQLNYILQFVGAKVFGKKVYIPKINKEIPSETKARITKNLTNFLSEVNKKITEKI
jgi:NAD(P)H-dependent FMN reductase